MSELDYTAAANEATLDLDEKGNPCAPAIFKEPDKIYRATPEQLKNMEKLYASQLVGIVPDTKLPLSIFINNPLSAEEQKEMDAFHQNVIALIVSNDICDKVGINYLAQFVRLGCRDSIILNPEGRNFFEVITNRSTILAKKIKEVAGCHE